MPTPDRLPESWQQTRHDPRLPGDDLCVADDGDTVCLFRWDNADAVIRASTGDVVCLDEHE